MVDPPDQGGEVVVHGGEHGVQLVAARPLHAVGPPIESGEARERQAVQLLDGAPHVGGVERTRALGERQHAAQDDVEGRACGAQEVVHRAAPASDGEIALAQVEQLALQLLLELELVLRDRPSKLPVVEW